MPKLKLVKKEGIIAVKNRLKELELDARAYASESLRFQARDEYMAMMKAFESVGSQLERLEDDMTLESREQFYEALKLLADATNYFMGICPTIDGMTDISNYVMSTLEEVKTSIDDERKDLAQSVLRDAADIKTAEAVTRKIEQKRLRDIEPIRTSGYGYIYDTMPLYFAEIDNNADLKLLAGSHYNELKEAINALRASMKNHVDSGERISDANSAELKNVQRIATAFAKEVTGYTRAFDQLINMINGDNSEVSRALAATESTNPVQWKDELNYQLTITPETARNYHGAVVREILSEDETAITHGFASSGRKVRSSSRAFSRLYEQMDAYMSADDAYKNPEGKLIGGAALKNHVSSSANIAYSDMEQARNLLYMELRSRGFDDLTISNAFLKTGNTKGDMLADTIKEVRQEILDLAYTTDINKIDDKISDIYVNSMMACEEVLSDLSADQSKEGIIAHSLNLKPFVDFYTKELPKYAWNADGEALVKESIDRKLAAMGKPYRFDQLVSFVKGIAKIGEEEASRITVEGEISFEDSVNLASKIRTVKDVFAGLKNKKNIAEVVAGAPENFEQMVASHNAHYRDDVSKDSLIRDARYAYDLLNAESLEKKMKAEISEHGASKKFANVYKYLKQIALMESLDTNQDAINIVYNQLKVSCNEYLESRNPWSTAGKERYKLVARIGEMIDGSARFRKERALKVPPRRERDIIDAGREFIANTSSVFGDSKKMTKIKAIVAKLATDQAIGMDIPNYGGEVNYYELFKLCADYNADPKKADNQRKTAVCTLMLAVARRMNDPKISEIANYATIPAERHRVTAALDAYEDNMRFPGLKLDGFKNNVHSFVSTGYELKLRKKRIDTEYFIDSFFAMQPRPNKDFEDKKVYYNYNDPEKTCDVRAMTDIDIPQKVFAKAQVPPQLFSYLAFMDYSVNTFADGRPGYSKDSWDSIKGNFDFVYQNFSGGEMRDKIEGKINPAFNIKNAREHAKKMIEDAAADKDKLKEIAKVLAMGLKCFIPSASEPGNISEKHVSAYNFLGRYMKLINKSLVLEKAITDTGIVDKADMQLLRGYATVGDIALDAADAKSKIAQTLYQGKSLTKEEMINCKRALMKECLVATERSYMYATKGNASKDVKNQLTKKYYDLLASRQQYETIAQSKDLNVTADMKQKAEKKMAAIDVQISGVTTKLMNVDNEDPRIPALVSALGTSVGRKHFVNYINEMNMNDVTMDELKDMLSNDKKYMREYDNYVKTFSADFAERKGKAEKKEVVVEKNNEMQLNQI